MTPVKYECHSSVLVNNFTKSEKTLTAKLSNTVLSTPIPNLLHSIPASNQSYTIFNSLHAMTCTQAIWHHCILFYFSYSHTWMSCIHKMKDLVTSFVESTYRDSEVISYPLQCSPILPLPCQVRTTISRSKTQKHMERLKACNLAKIASIMCLHTNSQFSWYHVQICNE